jgi:hypothetical protein
MGSLSTEPKVLGSMQCRVRLVLVIPSPPALGLSFFIYIGETLTNSPYIFSTIFSFKAKILVQTMS